MTTPNRITLILGAAQLLTWALTYYIPAVTTGAVAAGLGVSRAAVLGGFSLALLATGIASPFACRRIDRLGGRTVLAGSIVVQAAGLLLMATAGGLVQWYVGWTVTGFGMAGGLYDAAFATAGRLLGAGAKPAITGITLLGGFASTLGWPLGAALVPWIGWRWTLMVYAGLLLTIALPLYLLLPRGVPAAPAASVGQAAPAPTHGRVAFACMAGFFTLRAGLTAVISVSGPALLQGLGIAYASAIGLVAIIGPAQVGIRLVQASFGRRWSPLTLTWLGAALLPALTLPLVWAAGSRAVGAAALLFVVGYGMSNGILTIARGTLPLQLFGPEGYATRIGHLALPVILAQAASPLLVAPLLSDRGSAAVLLVVALVGLLAAACLVPLGRGHPPAVRGPR